MGQISWIQNWLKDFFKTNWTNKKIPIVLVGIILFAQYSAIVLYWLADVYSGADYETARLLIWVIHSAILYPLFIFLINRKGN